jgi:hypothetical protein
MASRPFSQVLVEIELREKADVCSNANSATLRKRKKVSITLLCFQTVKLRKSLRPW